MAVLSVCSMDMRNALRHASGKGTKPVRQIVFEGKRFDVMSVRRFAVEVKSFLGPSLVNDFHLALGQFLNYRLALAQQDPQRRLYLAVPIETYATFFVIPFIQNAVQQYQIALVIYNAELQEIVQWIS